MDSNLFVENQKDRYVSAQLEVSDKNSKKIVQETGGKNEN